MFTDATGGVADGGPGADVIIAGGNGKHLLVGGLGRDSITGSFGADLINARDGKPGDTVTCRSATTRVMADTGDVVSGPCLQVDTANGKGTEAR
jgi:Ca2+-binding RTX toxin-like protein